MVSKLKVVKSYNVRKYIDDKVYVEVVDGNEKYFTKDQADDICNTLNEADDHGYRSIKIAHPDELMMPVFFCLPAFLFS
jgi:Na+-transporting NADH:ubiquinone oxidoreductase subunit NqrC